MSTKRRSAFLAAAALVLGGCTFEDGRGWATVTPTVHSSLNVDAAHAGADGVTLVTDRGAALTLTAFRLQVTALELLSAAAPASGAAFDPAHPPPDYTLCHGGHCHSEDGELVAYEDMTSALAAGGTAGGASVAQSLAADVSVDVLQGGEIALGSFEVGDVALAGVALVAGEVAVAGSVAVDGQSYPIDVRLAVAEGLRFLGDAQAALGREGRGGATFEVHVELPADLFDGLRLEHLARESGTIRIAHGHNEAVGELLLARLAAVPAEIRFADAGAEPAGDAHEHEHDAGAADPLVELAGNACFHFQAGPFETVAAAADTAAAAEAAVGHHLHEVALTEFDGGRGGYLRVTVAEHGEVFVALSRDITFVVLSPDGLSEIPPEKTLDLSAACAAMRAVRVYDLAPGAYLARLGPSDTEGRVDLLAIGLAGDHEHGEEGDPQHVP